MKYAVHKLAPSPAREKGEALRFDPWGAAAASLAAAAFKPDPLPPAPGAAARDRDAEDNQ